MLKRSLAVFGVLAVFAGLAYLDTKALAYSNTDSINAPPSNAYAITPSDVADLSVPCRAIWVGGAGNLSVDFVNSGSTIVLNGAVVGDMIWVRVKRVRSTSTTATNLVCLY